MAVGNTINVSVPAVGTTVESFTRSNGNTFICSAFTIGGTDYTANLNLRPAQAFAAKKSFGLTARISPSFADDPGTRTKGAVTVAVNISWADGSVMTTAEMSKFVKNSMSAFLHSNLIEDLSSGIAL